MSRRRRLSIDEFLLAILMIVALVVFDTIFDYGLLRVLQWRPTAGGWLAALIVTVFVGGIWLLVTSDPHYRFLHGDRVDAGPLYGRGTVAHCCLVDRAPVYEVALDSGRTIALVDAELAELEEIALVPLEPRRPWFRPKRLPS